MKKINIYLLLMVSVFSVANVKAAPNVKTEDSTDANTKENKCPYSIIVQDNLSGSKDMDFSDLDCMFYKTNENGEKVLREETDNIDFSCLQGFLDKYTNEEFAEATDNERAEGFPPTNNYCPVYCVEENEFIFPGFSPQINSGGHFTWTVEKNDDKNILDGLTVRLQGTKVCRTHVDLEQWIDDYKDIMEEIEDSIKETSPNSAGCDATPNANSGVADTVGCSWVNYTSKTVGMTISDYNSLKNAIGSDNKWELGDAVSSSLNNSFTAAVVNNMTGESYVSLVDNVGPANSNSNRYYVTLGVISQINNEKDLNDAKLDAVYNGYVDENGNTNGYSFGVFDGDYNAAAAKMLDIANRDASAVITVQIDVWELKCCEWEYEADYGWNKPTLQSSQGITRDRLLMPGVTNGYKYSATENACAVVGNSLTKCTNFAGVGCCCFGTKKELVTDAHCKGANAQTAESCKGKGGTWIKATYKTVCNKTEETYYYDQRYYIKCPANGTEATITEVRSGKAEQKTCSNVPTCPSGYTYSNRTNKCYKADIEKIYRKLNELANLRTQLKQCHDQLIDYDYYLETDMEIEYNETNDEPVKKYFPSKDPAVDTKLIRVDSNTDIDDGENILGKYSSEIVKPSKKSNVSDSITFFNKPYDFDENSVPYVVCTLSGLEKVCAAIEVSGYTDYWYDWFGRAYIAMYEYKLVDNFYRWVKIPSGESMSTKPTGDYEKYNRYIEIGYPNYPVHFSTPAGDYEGLNVRIKNVGYKNYLYNEYQEAIREYNSSLPEGDFASTAQNNELLHDCYYHVTEGEPYCPTVGCDDDELDLGSVRIVYRPISLENPFPARDGDGRDTGSNWCIINNEDKTSDCSNENENVDKYILNNRNVVGSEVYNKEPMYQITLNPALIKQIREYNKNTNYDDYNLYCSGKDGEEGTECRSHFVVGGMDETNLPSFRDAFVKEGETCGMSSDWDACDKLDGIER